MCDEAEESMEECQAGRENARPAAEMSRQPCHSFPPQEKKVVIPCLAAHSVSAGIAIARTASVGDAVLPCAHTQEEWVLYLYGWQHKYVNKLKEDLRALGCTPAVQDVLMSRWQDQCCKQWDQG